MTSTFELSTILRMATSIPMAAEAAKAAEDTEDADDVWLYFLLNS